MNWPEISNKIREIDTPFYLYDTKGLDNHVKEMLRVLPDNFHVHYALKANNNPLVTKVIFENGLGADCVSWGELQLAHNHQIDPKKIVLAGVGKTDKEIIWGIQHQILSFNVESVHELKVIDSIAGSLSKPAHICIRLNPNIDAKTHKYITTGLEENKFGILWRDLPEVVDILRNSNYLKFTGVHFHIGSQITEWFPFERLCVKANEALQYFRERNLEPKMLNVGGGLGIDYHHPESTKVDFQKYFGIFEKFLEIPDNFPVHFELGRSITANFGYLITRVLYIKKGFKTTFVIVDAGMTDLLRPSLYQAFHKIQNISSSSTKKQTYDIVGPICESSDTFLKNFELPETSRNDYLVIFSAGAYGEVMSSNYNMREKPSSVDLQQLLTSVKN